MILVFAQKYDKTRPWDYRRVNAPNMSFAQSEVNLGYCPYPTSPLLGSD